MRLLKADLLMVLIRMVHRGNIPISEIENLINKYSDCRRRDNLNRETLPLFCLLARQNIIPETEIEQLVRRYSDPNLPRIPSIATACAGVA